ncbi:MAG: NAD(P)-dependent oxidoreductase [Porphyromonadaceae bacterium]|nr:NAD(P)-dependent oxidoreductase [Porphyromonadaceae bacterium]
MTSQELIKQRRTEDWRNELRRALPNKERMALDRTEQSKCTQNLDLTSLYTEDILNYTHKEAKQEAQRCLDCPNPGCVAACPAGIHIPSFIKELERGNLPESWRILRESSTLSAICSRVCPHEKQCEGGCIYPISLKKRAVAIGALERYVATEEQRHRDEWHTLQPVPTANGHKVALIGAGPASFAAAHDLALLGYEVTMFDAAEHPGGVMRSGIPRFRLPLEIIDDEVARLRHYGVRLEQGVIVGRDISIDDLRAQGYEAFFLGTGACISNVMGVPGEDLPGVWLAGDYLARTNLLDPHKAGEALADLHAKRVAVIGGGNTAMDAVRTAVRLGAERAMIIYRRSREEMPATNEEIEHALAEGVELVPLHQVKAYHAGQDGRVARMELHCMKLTEPDESGRRRPVATGETVEMEVDLVVVCVGVSQDPLLPQMLQGLETKWGVQIVVDEDCQTSLPDIYAGGDVIRGGATVVQAMRDGRRAASAIHRALSLR